MNLGKLADEIGEDKAVKIAVEQLNMTEEYARFVIAMDRGEVDGDLIPIKESDE